MTPLLFVLLAATGGAARFLLDRAVMERTGGTLPYGVVFVNVAGSALLGAAAGAAAGAGSSTAHTVFTQVAVFSGAFTTFSTAAVETAYMLRAGRRRTAVLLWFAMALASIAAAALAFSASRNLAAG